MDFLAIGKSLNETAQPFVRVYIDGVPCEIQGCCSASILIRPGHDSDTTVLSFVLSWYSGLLAKLPWQPQTILDAGGNMGVATLALAHMYPMAQIVVVEPEPGNCCLLEMNTVTFPNVHVECSGLWDKDASLGMVPPYTVEVAEVTPGSLRAISMQSLLSKYNLTSFDYIKLDIEGSEWQLFRQDFNLGWLTGVKLMSLEAHPYKALPGDEDHLVTVLKSRGYDMSRHSEYEVWASQDLHPFLRPKQTPPALLPI
ncbi:g5965 [Coccomyxa elongata]